MLLDRIPAIRGLARITKAGLLFLLLSLVSLPAVADSFLWEVRTGGKTVYLLGSMHLLPGKAYPLPDAMEQAYRLSEVVVFETDIGKVGDEETQVALVNAGTYPEGETLMNELSTSVLEPYAETVERLKLPVAAMNRYRPWLAALTIEMSLFAQHHYKAELGVDRHFYDKAVLADKEILTLESISEQSELFTGMSPQLSQSYLQMTLESLDEIDYEPEELYEIWADGDEGDMEDLLEIAQDDYHGVYNRFIRERNQRWLPKILELLEGDKNALVVVGAMHLPGDHGLLRLIRNAGYDPEQLD